jgi:thiol:disulfide interchange protein
MKTMRTLFTLLLLTLTIPVFAAPGDVKWTAKLLPEDAHGGEGAQIVLTAQIEGDYHLYSLTKRDTGPNVTTLTLAPGKALEAAGEGIQPTPHTELDPGFHINVESYTGGVAFALPVKLKAGVTGAQQASVKVHYQVCRQGTCLLPKTVEVPVSFTAAAGAARPDHLTALTTVPSQPAFATTVAPASQASGGAPQADVKPNAAPTDKTIEDIQRAQKNGLASFILLSCGFGFLALLTPCVFPMVPITVSYFAKRREQPGGDGIRGAVAYCGGIVGTFTGLGLLMTLLFGATGIQKLAASPIVNLGLALLFLVLAANLLGVFEIIMPTKLTNSAQSGTAKGGLLGPLLMGLTFTLTSFTCTVAFVGTLLAAAAKGSIFYPVVGMLAFSTAFASPFFLLALFPQYLAKLPRAGSWMVSVKAFMGFLEIAAAMKFLSNADLVWSWGVLTRPVFLALWAMIGVIAGLYLLGGLRLPHDSATKYGWPRRLFGGLTVVGGLYCLLAIEGAPLGSLNSFLPPSPYPGKQVASNGSAGETLPFLRDYQAALAQAKAENKLVFVDFTGYTCTNCRQVEEGIFPQQEVLHELNKMVRVQLYTDNGTPENERNKDLEQKLTGVVTLPVYVIVSPEGQALHVQQGSNFNAAQFAAFLRDGRANATASR